MLFEGAGETGTINHLGVETETAAEVTAAEARLSGEGIETTGVDDTVCCYAEKTETWVHGPDGTRWEWYVKHGDADQLANEVKTADGPDLLRLIPPHRTGLVVVESPDSVLGDDKNASGASATRAAGIVATAERRPRMSRPGEDPVAADVGAARGRLRCSGRPRGGPRRSGGPRRGRRRGAACAGRCTWRPAASTATRRWRRGPGWPGR